MSKTELRVYIMILIILPIAITLAPMLTKAQDAKVKKEQDIKDKDQAAIYQLLGLKIEIDQTKLQDLQRQFQSDPTVKQVIDHANALIDQRNKLQTKICEDAKIDVKACRITVDEKDGKLIGKVQELETPAPQGK